MRNVSEELKNGLLRGYTDASIEANLALSPQFVSNDPESGRKVLVDIEDELRHCDQFAMSVAFVTTGGITPLLQTLRELEERNIPGKILTTDYLMFSDPQALEKLSNLRNIEVRMYRVLEKAGFHTKGYLFREGEIYRMIIGSSNMTLSAVTINKEWNTKLVGLKDGAVINSVLHEFRELWDAPETLRYEDFIDDYRQQFQEAKLLRRKQKEILRQHKIATDDDVVELQSYKLEPNSMQIKFIESLKNLKSAGEKKALLISATATGKTLAAAFAMRELQQRHVLFLVHREQIDKQAVKSFQRVLGKNVTYGILSGNEKNFHADYIFATVQTLVKDEILHSFKPDEFDSIIIDEVHRAGAPSYQKIVDYFKPDLLLGMTATPERTDGFDIYKMFDHNIAAEIRLQQAMEDDLLCPFHYFGITDLEVDGRIANDNQTGGELSLQDFRFLTSEERVKYILREAKYFGHSGTRLKGLIFCSRKEVGRELSRKMNEQGLQTLFLGGGDSQETRENAVKRLTSDKLPRSEQLDYILTVDIFNEGVDIPDINQVILLRPTQSPIIFVQQLGRGLRKAEGKEYVVILDFIGAYTNNYMIPIALSGDRSYNKDNIRRYVQEGTRVIPGSSTIHFDEISRKRIFSAIDSARLNDTKLLRDAYTKLKYQLGRIPSLMDFREYGSVDVTKYFAKFGSYYNFLVKYEKDYTIRFNKEKEQVIVFLSKKLGYGKRPEELIILRGLLRNRDFCLRLQAYADAFADLRRGEQKAAVESAVRNLTNQFAKDSEKKKYEACTFLVEDREGEYRLSPSFAAMLADRPFSNMVSEIVRFGLASYKEQYSHPYKDTNFQLYQKYTYEDVCLLLNWEKNMNAQNLGGYFYDSRTKSLPVFINYDKADDAIAYEDRFVSADRLIALSKHPRKVTSGDADHFYKRTPEDKDNRIYLFVRKNKEDQEAKEFYFLGEMTAQGEPHPIHMTFDITDEYGKVTGKKTDDAFEIDYRLDVPVRQDIYDYIVNE
ncbi:MAG: DEAD/DEAH box helicase [Eubacterium sp.]|nr:DEAD/DEAH box helicase [Eubacterium sp.]